MSLQQTIKQGIIEAMKQKDAVRLSVLRGIATAVTNELVATGRTPQSELSDDEVLTVITRTAKQRKDSIEQFMNAGRNDLAESEQAELLILQSFLPEQMSYADILTHVITKKNELSITDIKEVGKLMSAIMKDLKGRADGSLVKQAVEESFKG